MYKKNKKQLTYQAIKFVIVAIILIILSISIESIMSKFLIITGLENISTLAEIVFSTVTISVRILAMVGIIVYGTFTLTEVFGYLTHGREEGSVTKEEELQKRLRMGVENSMKKVYKVEGSKGAKPIISGGIREITEDDDIQRQINKNKGR